MPQTQLRKVVVCPSCDLQFFSGRHTTFCPGCHQLVQPKELVALR